MSRLNRCAAVLATVIVASFVAGCGNDRQNTQAGGAVAGAALGCGLGFLIGGDATDCALGAGAGGAAGLIAGSYVAEEKEDYVAAEDYLDAEIASAQQMNGALAQRNAQLRSDLAMRSKKLTSLQQMASGSAAAKGQLQVERDNLRQQIGALKPVVRSATSELETQRSLLQQAQEEAASPDAVAAYQQQVTTMERNVAELKQLVQQYAEVDDRISRSF